MVDNCMGRNCEDSNFGPIFLNLTGPIYIFQYLPTTAFILDMSRVIL